MVQQLVNRLATGNEQQRVIAAHTLSHLLETEEAKYRVLVGDPHANPNLRSHYTVGKVLAVLKVRGDSGAFRSGVVFADGAAGCVRLAPAVTPAALAAHVHGAAMQAADGLVLPCCDLGQTP